MDDYRSRIDVADDEVVSAFIKRMEIVRELAVYKMKNAGPIADSVREQAVIEHVRRAAGDYADYAERLYRAIFDISKDYQRSLIGHEG